MIKRSFSNCYSLLKLWRPQSLAHPVARFSNREFLQILHLPGGMQALTLAWEPTPLVQFSQDPNFDHFAQHPSKNKIIKYSSTWKYHASSSILHFYDVTNQCHNELILVFPYLSQDVLWGVPRRSHQQYQFSVCIRTDMAISKWAYLQPHKRSKYPHSRRRIGHNCAALVVPAQLLFC